MVIVGRGEVVEIDLRGGKALMIHECLHLLEVAITAKIELLGDHVAQAVECIFFGLFAGRFIGVGSSQLAVELAIVAMQIALQDARRAAAADGSI